MNGAEEMDIEMMDLAVDVHHLINGGRLQYVMQSLEDAMAVRDFLMTLVHRLDEAMLLPEDRGTIQALVCDFLNYPEIPQGVYALIEPDVRVAYRNHVESVMAIHERYRTLPSVDYILGADVVCGLEREQRFG